MSQDAITQAKARRLYQLKLNQAMFGVEAHPQVVNEIADLEAAGVLPEAPELALQHALSSLARHADRGLMAALITSCAALMLAVLDFVLILVLR